MHLAQTTDTRQLHTQRTDPRQIFASEVLAWTQAELELAVERAIAENPAFECEDTSPDSLPDVSFSPPSAREDVPFLPRESAVWEDHYDPWERVAGGVTLRDHLRAQLGQTGVPPPLVAIVRYLIECVDERGYFVGDVKDIADSLQAQSSQVEAALCELHRMEPPGVGARTLQECLLLQYKALRAAGERPNRLAYRLLMLCWDDLAAHREARIAQKLECSRDDVRDAIHFLRHRLVPHPAAGFRPEHSSSILSVPTVRPDVVFVLTSTGIHVELTRQYPELRIAPQWESLASQGGAVETSAICYARDQVEQAKTLIGCLVRRGRTLLQIAAAIAERQSGYIQTGNRAFLRPLTRQSLAEDLQMDESVVSRAVADKWAQICNGDTVPLDIFFGNAQAVREALVRLVAGENSRKPYSDDQIALLLTEQGFPLARRTVAKYRSLERILPTRLRRRETG